MGNLFAKMIPLGLAAAVSPTMLATALFILGLKDRPRERMSIYIAGGALAVVIIGAAAIAVGGAVAVKSSGSSKVSGTIDLALGALLLFLGIRNLIKKLDAGGDKRSGKSRIMKYVEGSGLFSFFFLGVVMMATNFSSLVFYLAAAKETADSGLAFPIEAAAMVIVAFFMLLPAVLPLTLAIMAPGIADRVTAALNNLINRYGTYIGPLIALLFGVYLLFEGAKAFGIGN